MARRLKRVAHDRVPAAAPLRRQLAAEGERCRGVYFIKKNRLRTRMVNLARAPELTVDHECLNCFVPF